MNDIKEFSEIENKEVSCDCPHVLSNSRDLGDQERDMVG